MCATLYDSTLRKSVVIPGDVISFTSYKASPRDGIVAMFNSSELNRCLLSVLFLCDPDVLKGVFELDNRAGVNRDENTVWIGRSASRTCSDEDVSYTFTECINGKKNQTSNYRSDMCTHDYIPDVKELTCENKMSISVSALIGILVASFVVLAGSITLIVVLVVRNRKIYGKYKQLRMESQNSMDVVKGKEETVPSAAEDAESQGEDKSDKDDNMDEDAGADDDDKINVRPTGEVDDS